VKDRAVHFFLEGTNEGYGGSFHILEGIPIIVMIQTQPFRRLPDPLQQLSIIPSVPAIAGSTLSIIRNLHQGIFVFYTR
jgi:hypothetical protein